MIGHICNMVILVAVIISIMKDDKEIGELCITGLILSIVFNFINVLMRYFA